MLFVLIFAISFLANTISVEMFQALEFTCSVHYVFFWQFVSYSIKNQCQEKSERPSGRLHEIDLQETKTEQSQRLWRTETNVQTSIKRWCYNYMYIDFYWFYASLWYCICSVLWLWPLSSWKCFEWPFPRKGCTSLS